MSGERYYDLHAIIRASVILGFLLDSRVGIHVVSWTGNFGLACR